MKLTIFQRFLLGVLAFMPLCFTLWYWFAPWHLLPLVKLTQLLLQYLFPNALMWLQLQGHELVIASNFGADSAGQIVSPPIGDDALGFMVNPLIYGYGLPLLVALILATPAPDKLTKLMSGVLLILPLQYLSMVLSVLKRLVFDVGSAFQIQQGMSQWGVDGVGLLYQVTNLLLPMVAPLVIWLIIERRFLGELAPPFAAQG